VFKDLEGAIYQKLRETPTDGEYIALLKAFQHTFSPFIIVDARKMAGRIADMLEMAAKEQRGRESGHKGFEEGL